MGRYLPETLRSIRAQTFTDYEKSSSWMTAPPTHCNVRCWRHGRAGPAHHLKQNGGLSSARSRAAKRRGHYVLPLDADDPPPAHLPRRPSPSWKAHETSPSSRRWCPTSSMTRRESWRLGPLGRRARCPLGVQRISPLMERSTWKRGRLRQWLTTYELGCLLLARRARAFGHGHSRAPLPVPCARIDDSHHGGDGPLR